MIILILILGLFLRLLALNQSLWLDEAIEVLGVKSNSYLQLIIQYSLGDFHPPLFHIILKFWTNIFGYSEISVRIPSIIFGLLAVYFTYKIGKTLFSERIGLLGGLFLAINPLAIYYSQEARMYSLAMCAVVLSVYFFIKKNWLFFVLSTLLVLYTDYLPYLMLPVFFLISKNKTQIIKLISLIVIFLIPLISLLIKQLSVGLGAAKLAPGWGQVVGSFELKSLPLVWVKFIVGRISLTNKILYGLIITSISLIYIYIIAQAKNKLLWTWFLLPLLLGIILTIKIPVFSYFRFIFVLPAFCLLLVQGLKNNKVLLIVLVVISLISWAFFVSNPSLQREDWQAAVNYIHSQPGQILMPSLAQSSPLKYYDSSLNIQDKNNLKFVSSPVYLFRYVQEIFDPQDLLRQKLESSGYQKTSETSFNGILVWKYEKI